jgi:K+-sensing histidine kinase KdpD
VDHGGAVSGHGQDLDDRRFVRVLCHELRTPVASVQALARALSQPATRLSVEQRIEAAQLIADHAQHLSALLEAVGAVANHLPGTANASGLTRIRLAELIHGAAHAAGLPQLDAHIAPPVEVVTIDAPTVRRIVTNLLENARRHGAEPIHLRADHHGRSLRILIVDSGPGLPAEVSGNAFRQGAPPADGPHGLGLWIVTQLVTMLAGAVRTEPNTPHGTRIEVVLPLPG